MKPDAALGLLTAGVLAGCSAVHWGRHPSQEPQPEEDRLQITASRGPAHLHPAEALPKVDAAGREIIYYSDLGPDTIDVSDYPTQQKYNYTIYAGVCSHCHTLARSINAPVASRGFWELYVLGMRAVNRLEKNEPITKEQKKAVLDFLEFDSQARKIERKKEFEAQTEELKRRYEPLLRERIRKLQESAQPMFWDGGS